MEKEKAQERRGRKKDGEADLKSARETEEEKGVRRKREKGDGTRCTGGSRMERDVQAEKH